MPDTPAYSKRLKVVVCGTRFGEHYLSALTAFKPADSRYELAGILARGSQRSQALARRLAVPLFNSPQDIPNDIDIACVVVRSAIVGGDGSFLARALLERGIHVLQEHPVHPTDMDRLRELAIKKGRRYHVNTFYPHLPAGRCFIDYAQQSAKHHRPEFIEITTSLQLLYSSLDLVSRAVGNRTAGDAMHFSPLLELEKLAENDPQPWPLRSLQGLLFGVPFSLHLQTFLDPADPDHHSLVMHRIAIGGAQGHVLLANSFGPVVWCQSVYAQDYDNDSENASYLLQPQAMAQIPYNRRPSALVFGPSQAPSLCEAVRHDFPLAIHAALDELMDPASPVHHTPWWHGHNQAWLHIMRSVGKPVEVSRQPPADPRPDPEHYMEFALNRFQVVPAS